MESILHIHSSTSGHAREGTLRFRFEVANMSPDTIHVFDGERMPYLTLQADGSLLVLQGIHAPDPDIDYALVGIPATRAIAPGGRWVRDVALSPLMLADHYGEARTATALHGRTCVHCHVAWGRSPVPTAGLGRISLDGLLGWQQWAKAAPIEVDFD